MKCNNCGHDNKPGAKFCSGCGAPLRFEMPTTAPPAADVRRPTPATPPRPQPTPARRTPTAPQTLMQLVTMVLKSVIQSLPRQVVRSVLLAGVVWLAHTFLLVVVNEGFYPSGNPLLSSVLALPSKWLPGTLFWVLAGMMFAEVRQGTFGKKITAIGRLPALASQALRQGGAQGAPALWMGGAAALLLSTLFGNFLVSLQMALFALGALVAPVSLLGLAIQLGWSDFQRTFRASKSSLPLQPAVLGVAINGLVLGFSVAALLHLLAGFALWFATLVAVGVAAFQVMRRKGTPTGGAAALSAAG